MNKLFLLAANPIKYFLITLEPFFRFAFTQTGEEEDDDDDDVVEQTDRQWLYLNERKLLAN